MISVSIFRCAATAVLAAAALAATGCGSREPLPLLESETRTPIDLGESGATTTTTTDSSESGRDIEMSPLEVEPTDNRGQLVIYFEFDQIEIRPEFGSTLAAHAQYLAQNPGAQLRLEGHADERGSREYNIGLGERRAQAVRRALLLQGASAGQLSTVSYGEERPAASGSDEEAFSLNRRVELVYRQ